MRYLPWFLPQLSLSCSLPHPLSPLPGIGIHGAMMGGGIVAGATIANIDGAGGGGTLAKFAAVCVLDGKSVEFHAGMTARSI